MKTGDSDLYSNTGIYDGIDSEFIHNTSSWLWKGVFSGLIIFSWSVGANEHIDCL